MKYSYNWIKELSKTKLSPDEIGEKITMHSFEVEEIEKKDLKLKGVLVGEILEISKHPNADKLQLTKVKIGKETFDIVCGAHNISVGDKVPVATVGTILPNGLEIKEAEIRGQKSFGMLCAQDELALGNDHSGILLLDKKIETGKNVADILLEKDTIFDIKILPDRAHDMLSHIGMAREIAALCGERINYPYDKLILPKKKTNKLEIKIADKTLCARYIGGVFSNIKIQKSPIWLKNRLENCGIRSINNVVDATNLIMLEFGQPLHTFDFDKVSLGEVAEIVVRNAKEGEEIKILDGSLKKLSSEDIIIASPEKNLALAGIMGGFESGINENTTKIILEAANFNATSIRKTKNRLNLFTDAAQRFEKEIDPNIAEKAFVRIAEILEEIAGAKFEGLVDVYPKKKEAWSIKLDMSYVERLLGEKISAKIAKDILINLGFIVKGNEKNILVEVPTFRLDAITQEDLIEEIGRIYGYEKIKSISLKAEITLPIKNEERFFQRNVKDILVSQGFSEVLNYAFYGNKDADNLKLGEVPHFELEMPLTKEHNLLRVSLLPNLLKNVAENLKREKAFEIFEIGKVFWPAESALNRENIFDKGLPNEKKLLTAIIATSEKIINKKNDFKKKSPFYEVKGKIDLLMAQLGITDFYYDNFQESPLDSSTSVWHPTRSAEIKVQNLKKPLGFVGEINPFVLKDFGIENRVASFEFDMEVLRKISDAEREFMPISKYPVVLRDISLIFPKNIKVDDILQAMQEVGGEMLLDSDLFDIFDFEDGSSSFAFHLLIGSREKTLTSQEIEDIVDRIVKKLEKKFAAKLRK